MRLAHLHLPSITPFTRVSNIQQTLTNRLLLHKKNLPGPETTATSPDPTIITFTPNPVYTTGRRDLPPSNTCPQNRTLSLPPSLEPIRPLLSSPDAFASGNTSSSAVAEYHPTLRGGQTTYHGPGQMVAYTILDLRRLGLTPRCHIRLLENSVIDVLSQFGIRGTVTEDPGVWVPPSPTQSQSQTPTPTLGALPKKITAVGVHLRRNISSYGIGFNVSQEPMWYFQRIVACGLEGREATSLEGQGVNGVAIDDVAGRFVDAFMKRVNGDFACQPGKTGEGIDEVYTVQEGDLVD